MPLTEDSEAKAHVIFKDIWSPYCKGVSLLECPSGQAENLRSEIRARLRNGESQEEILSGLKSKYGDTLRMQPSFEGRESLAYSVPWISFFLVIAILLVFTVLRRQRRVTSPQVKTPSALQPEMMKKIMKDLDED